MKILNEILSTLQSIEQKITQNRPLAATSSPQVEIQRVEVPVEVVKKVKVPVEVIKEVKMPDDFTLALSPYRQFSQAIAQDEVLARLLRLNAEADESQRFIQAITNAGQWDKLDMIWQELASRCKTAKRPANANEQHILNTSLALFNFTTTQKATLYQPEIGEDYHYEVHQRGNLTGEQIKAIWLAGIKRNNEVKLLPVVETV